MKVKDLIRGMFLKPKGNYRWYVVPGYPKTLGVFRGTLSSVGEPDQYAVYLGTRKEINYPNRVPWSNRFCLFKGQILPIDSPDWRYIEPALTPNRE